MSNALIETEALCVHRGFRPVIRDLTFTFAGGVLGVMGPNGAGKSTLLRVLGEGAAIRSGTVRLTGVRLGSAAGLTLIRDTVGYQPQKPSVVSHFSVSDNVRYAAWLKGVSSRGCGAVVAEVLEAVNLTRKSTLKARRLSGGELKRLAVGLAIVHRPGVVVLDEPTAALDPDEHDSMLALIRTLSTRSSVVFTSHDPGDIAGTCDEVLVLADGSSRFQGSVDELTRGGKRTVVEGYRAAVSA